MPTLLSTAEYVWETHTPRTLSAGADSATNYLEQVAEYVWETHTPRTLTGETGLDPHQIMTGCSLGVP